jgi:hypothetical protein
MSTAGNEELEQVDIDKEMSTPVRGKSPGGALLLPSSRPPKDSEFVKGASYLPRQPMFASNSAASEDSMSSFLNSFASLVQNRLAVEQPQSSTSVAKVQAPKNYQVHQNFRIWLERFHTYATLAKIPLRERRSQLLSRLDHQAYVAVVNLHLPEDMPYTEFTQALESRFHNTTREDYKLQLKGRVHGANESYEAYSDALPPGAVVQFIPRQHL